MYVGLTSQAESMTGAGLQHCVSKTIMMPVGTFALRVQSDVAKLMETLKTFA
jgi:hypothetical protein